MGNKKRPYLIEDRVTGTKHMVIGISQAQVISHLARMTLAATPASPLDVVAHMKDGGSVIDATAAPAAKEEPPAGTPTRDDGGEALDDDDIPPGAGGETSDWGSHIRSGIEAKT